MEPMLARNKKDFANAILFIIYMTLVNFIPIWAKSPRDPACVAGPRLLLFNNYYAWIVVGSWLTCKLLF